MNKQTALVFRIENDDGVGPFRSYVCHESWDYWHYVKDPDKHPTPCKDKVLSIFWKSNLFVREEFSFGFVSEKQLREWFDFTDHLEALKQCDFHCAVYTVDLEKGKHDYPAMMIGDKQVIFRKETALSKIKVDLSKFI